MQRQGPVFALSGRGGHQQPFVKFRRNASPAHGIVFEWMVGPRTGAGVSRRVPFVPILWGLDVVDRHHQHKNGRDSSRPKSFSKPLSCSAVHSGLRMAPDSGTPVGQNGDHVLIQQTDIAGCDYRKHHVINIRALPELIGIFNERLRQFFAIPVFLARTWRTFSRKSRLIV